jgi:hypothetical protein
VNFTHPLASVAGTEGGVLLGVLGGVLVGRFVVCSCALREKLKTSVIMTAVKKLFILGIPSGRIDISRPGDYNPRFNADDTESSAPVS